jgi:hypothetical protein
VKKDVERGIEERLNDAWNLSNYPLCGSVWRQVSVISLLTSEILGSRLGKDSAIRRTGD